MSLFQQKGVGLSHIDKISSHSIASSIQTAIEVLEDGGWRDTKVKVIKQTTRHAASSGSTSEIGRGRRTPNKVKQKIQLSKLPRRKGEKMNWFKRTSTHPVDRDLSYDEFRTFLLENHTDNEQKYIPDLKSFECLKVLQKGQVEVYQMMYRTPFGASNRDFAELIITKELSIEPGSRKFVLVQIPVLDVPPRTGYTRAKYTSVEVVEERLDGRGDVEVLWRMAVASSAGGAIPQLITDASLPGQIAHDVPNFIGWVQKQRSDSDA